MSTSNSPVAVIRQQAEKMADMLRAAERGEPVPPPIEQTIREARGRPSITIGIVMDDKVVRIEIPWEKIKNTGRHALTEYIVRLMRGQQDTMH